MYPVSPQANGATTRDQYWFPQTKRPEGVMRILSVLVVGDLPPGATRPVGEVTRQAMAVVDRRYKQN
jgi:hypothetical protein